MGIRRRGLVLILSLAAAGLTPIGCATTRIPADPLLPSPQAEARPTDRASTDAVLGRLARTVDGLEAEIEHEGVIGIKAPDIWGQDRMTKFRAEYEQQLAGQQKDGFKSVMSAVIRRYEAVTSQIEMDAVAIPGPPTNSASTGGANVATAVTRAAAPAPAPIRDATEKEPIGVESTVVIDERSHFLNHLNQLRRINSGDELTDRPGYGLYLIRMPITLAPGRERGRGRGAVVTVEVRPYMTRSLLPDTVRRVVLEGTKEQLRPIVLAGLRGMPSSSGDGAVPILLPAELEALFGAENLKKVCEAAKQQVGPDLAREPHRAEVRVAEWLDRELAAVYPLSDVAAGPGSGLTAMGDLVARRRFPELARYRDPPTAADRGVVQAGAEELRIGGGRSSGLDAAGRVERTMAFALQVQAAAVDRMIREDIRKVGQDTGRNHLSPDCLAHLDAMTFAGPDPSEEARRVFNEYVAAKWRIRVFAIEPVLEQQNVADFLSRRSMKRLDIAGVVGAGAGSGGAAASAGAQSDVDAAAVRLNPTMVGFGVGESTFGWRFYPRVQVPGRDDLIQKAERLVLGEDPTAPVHQLEPGQRECTALVVMPSFVPAIEFTTVAGWFHHSAVVGPSRPTEMEASLAMVRKIQKARADLDAARRGLGPEPVRARQLEILEHRLHQLEALLPTQDYVSALPYGSEAVGAEIFESRGGHLAPVLTAWHGQPPDGKGDASIMIEGRGFSVHDTRVIAGNAETEAIPLSRTVLQVKIPAKAQTMTSPDGKCYYDVHAATPNGISNHLLIEVRCGAGAAVEAGGWLKAFLTSHAEAPKGPRPESHLSRPGR